MLTPYKTAKRKAVVKYSKKLNQLTEAMSQQASVSPVIEISRIEAWLIVKFH